MVLNFGGQRKYYRIRWWVLFQNDGISNVYKTLKIKYEFFSLKRVTMLQISMFPKEIKQKKRNVVIVTIGLNIYKKRIMSIQVRIIGWAVNEKKRKIKTSHHAIVVGIEVYVSLMPEGHSTDPYNIIQYNTRRY